MTNAPERVWIRNDTSRCREELGKLAEKPSVDVMKAYEEYIDATSLTARDVAMVRAGMNEAAKIADSQGRTKLAQEILGCSVDTETMDRIITRVQGQDV